MCVCVYIYIISASELQKPYFVIFSSLNPIAYNVKKITFFYSNLMLDVQIDNSIRLPICSVLHKIIK